jgi:hypothetical protein
MRRTLWFASALALLIQALVTPAPSPAGPPPQKASCVFTNPGFSGKCVENVDVAEGSSPAQACQSVLSCLNDVDCLKTYCQATTIRSGWKLESAK